MQAWAENQAVPVVLVLARSILMAVNVSSITWIRVGITSVYAAKDAWIDSILAFNKFTWSRTWLSITPCVPVMKVL